MTPRRRDGDVPRGGFGKEIVRKARGSDRDHLEVEPARERDARIEHRRPVLADLGHAAPGEEDEPPLRLLVSDYPRWFD